jgi:hypothetical protein
VPKERDGFPEKDIPLLEMNNLLHCGLRNIVQIECDISYYCYNEKYARRRCEEEEVEVRLLSWLGGNGANRSDY